jgi:type III secretion protein J
MSANLLDYRHSHATSLTVPQWQRVQTMLLRLCVFCLFLLLCACSETTNLQAGLNDADANEIVSVLNRHGITAQKRTTKEGVILTVKMSDISRATEVMHAAGLPRRTRANLGQVFKKEGMISTPLEERVRYIHGLSEELEFTLQQFDNVVSARVHVVLPERIAPGEPIQPSSAAVFVKYRLPFDEDTAIPRIRNLVASSIPGLSGESGHDNVSVVLAPSEATAPAVEWTQVGPFIVQAGSAGTLIAALLLMAGVAAASLFYAFTAGGRRQVLGDWARKHFGRAPAFHASDEG